MGADTQKRTLFSSRGASLLQRLQRGVALESHGESSSSFGVEPVAFETVSMRTGCCQWALTRKQTLEKARSTEWVLSGLIGERTLYGVGQQRTRAIRAPGCAERTRR